MTNDNSNQVAQTILHQLGGSRFIAMTGSTNFTSDKDKLTFKVGSNPKGVTHMRITLTPRDLYKVEALKVRKLEVKTLSEADDVYFDMLEEVFTRMTGLYTRL
jgi:hypothetical protein